MSNIKEIINTIKSEDLATAKTLIKEDLLRRVGTVLEEQIEIIAPSMISEVEEKESTEKPGKSKMKAWGKNKPDKDDKKSSKNESYESEEVLVKNNSEEDEDDQDLIDFDEFVNEVHEIVQEIENETGEELTEQEIQELGREYLNYLTETSEE